MYRKLIAFDIRAGLGEGKRKEGREDRREGGKEGEGTISLACENSFWNVSGLWVSVYGAVNQLVLEF